VVVPAGRLAGGLAVGPAVGLAVALVVGLVAPLVAEQVVLCGSVSSKLLAPPLPSFRGAGAGGLGESALALSKPSRRAVSAADPEAVAASTAAGCSASAFRRLFGGGGSSKAA
jgi:predicted lipid-binding transport protein (Tim44 family)